MQFKGQLVLPAESGNSFRDSISIPTSSNKMINEATYEEMRSSFFVNIVNTFMANCVICMLSLLLFLLTFCHFVAHIVNK